MAKIREANRQVILGDTALTEIEASQVIEIGKGFAASVNGLTVKGKPSVLDWTAVGRTLRVMERGAQFAIGDFLIRIEDQLGEEASQVVDYSEGWSEKTCDTYRWMASRIVQGDRRMDRLTVRHHMLVARLAPSKQRHWLKLAAADGEEHPWTVARLKKAMNAGGDLPVTGWYLVVTCGSEAQQEELQSRLTSEGFSCKPGQSRKKREEKEAAA